MDNMTKLERIAEMEKQLKQLKIELKEEETKKPTYPIYKKSKESGIVVKFTAKCVGEVVASPSLEYEKVGRTFDSYVPHDNEHYWEDVPVCPTTGFFHGQPVWCWDEISTHLKTLKFYDAKNECTYSYIGESNSFKFVNYEPYKGPWEDWMYEAFRTLKD